MRDSADRSVAMAPTSNWNDVEKTMADLRWFKEACFRGAVLPMYDPHFPLYHPKYEPIWSLFEELDLIANSHGGMSASSNAPILTPGAPHPGCAVRLYCAESGFYVHNMLPHMVWGGVFERHPKLKVVFTEQGSGWITTYLEDMDYAYEHSYLRRDLRDVMPHKPSEYFRRQCYVGASIFSRAEVEHRHEIGLSQMMIGMDYPHHEGTMPGGTKNYLQATFGAANVPEDEARLMLGETAVKVYGFDLAKVRAAADEVGPWPSEILTPPTEDLFPRGDVHKPLLGGFS
jgi:predicted TIM-barrel fold metal-dependent hydrolase